MTNIFVSIILPTFNRRELVQQAIQSVLVQTYANFELVVIDDCSNDGTKEVLERISEQDSRLVVVYNDTNRGVHIARNTGLSISKGDLICFLDSDDQWKPNKLRAQVQLMTTSSAIACHCDVEYLDVISGKRKIVKFPRRVTAERLLERNYLIMSAVMFKKDCIKDMVFNDVFHEDYDFHLSVFSKNGGFSLNTTKIDLIYLHHQGNLTKNKLKSIIHHFGVQRRHGIPYLKIIFLFLKNIVSRVSDKFERI